jgi:hypothetical protein
MVIFSTLAELDASTVVNAVYFLLRIIRHRGLIGEGGPSEFIRRSREATARERRIAMDLSRELEARVGQPLTTLGPTAIAEVVTELLEVVNARLNTEFVGDEERSRSLLAIMRGEAFE